MSSLSQNQQFDSSSSSSTNTILQSSFSDLKEETESEIVELPLEQQLQYDRLFIGIFLPPDVVSATERK